MPRPQSGATKDRLVRVQARSVTGPRHRPPRAGAGWPWSPSPDRQGRDRPEVAPRPRQIDPSEQMLRLASAPKIRPPRAGSRTILAPMRFISLPEQVGREQVTDALVVVRVQPEHVAVVSHGAFDIAQLHKGSSKTGPRTHVWSRLEEAPEMARIVLEAFRPERHLARLHALGIIVPRFLDGPGSLFGQQDVATGTERRDTECLACQCEPRSGGVCSQASYITSCALAVAVSPPRPVIA